MGIVSQGRSGRKLFASIRSRPVSCFSEALLWAVLLLPVFYTNWDLFVFYIFESRDIQRAREILAGNFIFYGPEVSGGGNLPGPAYYFLKAAVLWVFDTWEALGHFLFFSSALSLGFFAAWMRRRTGLLAVVIFLCCVMGPGHYVPTLQFFNNPSFLTPVIIALFFLLWRQARLTGYGRAIYLGLYFFLTALAIQFHMQMAAFFLFPFFVETQFAQGARPRSRLVIACLCLFGALPALSPFIWGLWQSARSNEGVAAGSMINAPVFLLESFYFKMQYLLGRAQAVPLSETFDWRSVRRTVQYLLAVIPFAYWYVHLKRHYGGEGKRELDRWIEVIFRGWLVLLPFGSYYLFTSLGQRYGMVFSIINSLALALVYHRLNSSDRRRFGLVLLGVAGAWLALTWLRALPMLVTLPALAVPALLPLVPFAIAALFRSAVPRWQAFMIAALVALPFTQLLIGRTYVEDPSQNLYSLHIRKICRAIIARTGWSWDLAQNRIFLIGVQYETDLGEIYRLEYSRWKAKGGGADLREVPDGFFVKPGEFGAKEISATLVGIGLEHRLESEIASGGIEVKPLAKINTVDLLEYRVRTPDYPRHFHNLGLGYNFSELEVRYARRSIKGPEIEKVNDHEFVARWNDCRKKESYCGSAVRIRMVPKGNDQLEMQLLVLGRPLSVPSQWILPDFTQSLKDLSVEVDCESGVQRKMLPSQIGFFSVEAGRLKSYVLGPLEYSFEFSCKGGPRKIKVAWPSSTVIERIRSGDIPGHEFIFEISELAEARVGTEARAKREML